MKMDKKKAIPVLLVIMALGLIVGAFCIGSELNRKVVHTKTTETVVSTEEVAKLRQELVTLQQQIREFRTSTQEQFANMTRDFNQVKNRKSSVTIRRPDGTVITKDTDESTKTGEKTTTDTGSKATTTETKDTDTKATAAKTEAENSKKTEAKARTDEKTETPVAALGKWNFTLGVGGSIPGLFGKDVPNILPDSDYTPEWTRLHLAVDRALFWGFRGGVWGNSGGDVGLQLSWGR